MEQLLSSSVAPKVFGMALLCAGQLSTFTGTISGQVVLKGFMNISLKPWMRRLLTRSSAIIPASIIQVRPCAHSCLISSNRHRPNHLPGRKGSCATIAIVTFTTAITISSSNTITISSSNIIIAAVTIDRPSLLQLSSLAQTIFFLSDAYGILSPSYCIERSCGNPRHLRYLEQCQRKQDLLHCGVCIARPLTLLPPPRVMMPPRSTTAAQPSTRCC